jgi:phage recombination protein Bet
MTAVVEMSPAQTQRAPSLLARVAERYGVDATKMLDTLKNTAFKVKEAGGGVSNEQMMALLIVADQFRLNPFTKEIYAFPDKGGIVPVVGVDGWSRIINEHPQFDGMEFTSDDASCTCTMYRKDRTHPIVVTEFLAECKRGTQPWQSHPKRMLRHKAMIQCARLAFGFAGIYDPDEAERVREMGMVDEVQPAQGSSLAAVRSAVASKTTPHTVDAETGEITQPAKAAAPPAKTLAAFVEQIDNAVDAEQARGFLKEARDALAASEYEDLEQSFKAAWEV